MTSFKDLPSELLGLIFEYLYLANRVPNEYNSASEWEVQWDFRDPNLFPWVLSRVCRHWAHIVAQYPYFWTRIALDISSKEPLPLGALERSEDYLTQVLVYNSGTKHFSVEKNRVQAINNALSPHLGRCTSLEYDVALASSLPNLPVIIQQTPMPSLQILNLKCTTFDLPESQIHIPDPHISLTSFRSMQRFTLPMSTFIAIGRIDPGFWRSSTYSNSFFTLELYHYEFSESKSSRTSGAATLSELIPLMWSLRGVTSLKLRDLSMILQPNPPPRTMPSGLHPIAVAGSAVPLFRFLSLTLTNLSKTFLNGLFQHCSINVEDAEIYNCTLPNNAHKLAVNTLTLVNVPLATAPSSIFSQFTGSTIYFNKCPGLSDHILHLLSNEGCKKLQHLLIERCGGYSMQGLRRLIEDRERHSGEAVRAGKVFPRLESLILEGDLRPPQEEAAWFTEHLAYENYRN